MMALNLDSPDCRKKIQAQAAKETPAATTPDDEFGDMDDFDMPTDDTDASAEDEGVFEGEQLGIFNDVSSLVNARKVRRDRHGRGGLPENCSPPFQSPTTFPSYDRRFCQTPLWLDNWSDIKRPTLPLYSEHVR